MSTLRSLEQLSKIIKSDDFLKIVESQIRYPKTSEFNKTSNNECIEMPFDCSNGDTLNTLLTELKTNINLKYFGLTNDIMFVLKSLFDDKNAILLSQADYLIIEKNNYCLLKLENSSKPNSGRSIHIDVYNFRQVVTTISDEIVWKRIKGVSLFAVLGFMAFRAFTQI
jgi:hypothetical protein